MLHEGHVPVAPACDFQPLSGPPGTGLPEEDEPRKRADFLASQPRCVVAMEACGGAHLGAEEVLELGHEVRLMPPVYVKPFVKRQKTDAADAEAIVEAAERPTMRFVAVKTEEAQARSVVYRSRELLVRHRTQTIWALTVSEGRALS